MKKKKEVPVYLFTGFLDAGKTKFIQQTLLDERFNSGEQTLLILCEEGEEAYDLSEPMMKNVHILTIENESELTTDTLAAFEQKHRIDRVIVEFNGMWQLQPFFTAMPENWLVYQEVMLAEYATFLSYNQNMRSLMVDKLMSCEMLVLNRAPVGCDKTEIHKVVRGVSRSADIGYDYVNGDFDYDEIEDPLPYDLDAPIVEIKDEFFAVWYRDMTENMEQYKKKVLHFKARAVTKNRELKNCFVLGRHVMTCCADDITFMGLVCESWPGELPENGAWYTVTASVSIKFHAVYGRSGPVLSVREITPADPPEQEVATFY